MSMFKNAVAWVQGHKRMLIMLALIFLTNTISFALGYLMASDQQHSPIVIEKVR